MSFRFRILLYVSVALAVVLGGVLAAVMIRERQLQEENSARLLAVQSALWESLVEGEEDQLRLSYEALHNEDLAAGLVKAPPDPARLAELVGRSLDAGMAEEGFLAAEVVNVQMEVAYSTAPGRAHISEPVVATWLLRKVMNDAAGVHGLSRLSGSRIAVTTCLPVMHERQVVGVISYARSIDNILEALAKNLSVDAMILDKKGRIQAMSEGADPRWAESVKPKGNTAGLHVAAWDDRSFAVSTIPLNDLGGGRLGYLAVFRDVTQQVAHGRSYRDALVAATLLFAVIVLLGLYATVRQSFLRLDEVILVLNRLARGETVLTFATMEGNDEIGRLGQAVELFRRNALALAKHAKDRGRRRRRQERFIRNRMQDLAEGFGGDFGDSLLKELSDIETAHAEKLTKQLAEGGRQQAPGDAEELGIIADAFEHLADRVRSQYEEMNQLIAELSEALTHKAALASLQNELDIARKIQTSILPSDLSDMGSFKVSGKMLAAKGVGGDFYDFFKIDEHRLGVAVADVSGKGVPAAFFMLISRTLLKATAAFGLPPAEALSRLNDLLSVENEQSMFVTLFYGILDLKTGELAYSNGGHLEPFWLNCGEIRKLEPTNDMALAVMGGLRYGEGRVRLAPGDKVLLYTDGITEAFDPEDNLYGDERLIRVLETFRRESTREILDALVDSVVAFSADAPQADDVTLLALQYLPAMASAAPAGNAA